MSQQQQQQLFSSSNNNNNNINNNNNNNVNINNNNNNPLVGGASLSDPHHQQQPPQLNPLLQEKPSLETVRAAIKTVLSHDVNVDRKPASEWLDSLKNSIHAWEVCNQLLTSNEGIEVSYLAAHMLRQKISKNFNELPIEYYSSLKDSILNHLQTHQDYAVQGQLTMAIADLTLLLQIWQNPIEDLAQQLCLDVGLISLLNNDYVAVNKALQNRLIFACILNQMCDLNHNHSERPCRIGAKRREEYEDYLISKCSQAITWWLNTMKEMEELRTRFTLDEPASLNQLQNNSSSSPQLNLQQQQQQDAAKDFKLHCTNLMNKLIGQIYLCYSAWLRIFDEENVNESLELINSAMKHLESHDCPEQVHKFAVEVMVSTASFCEDNRQVDYLCGYLVNSCYSLEQAFRRSIAEEDIDKASNFVRAFTSVAETACLTHVIEKRDFKLVELLLSCLTHYDFEIVAETYAFWWALLEHLQNTLKQADYGPFIVYINRFVMAVTKLCQFDPDEDSVIEQDQDIHAFRVNSADIIINVMFVTTVEDFLRDNQLLDSLKLSLREVSWEKIEAILYLISCLVQMTTRDENHIRMQVFNSILSQQTSNCDIQMLLKTKQIPINIGVGPGDVHPQIIATSLRIIGSLESFLADYPDYLALAINYILMAISNPTYRKQLIKYAATALCNIMEVNATRHFSNCPELLVIVKDLCTSLDQFDEHAASELLKCSAFMADAIQETNVKSQFLCQIVSQNLNSLKNTLNSTTRDESEPSKYLDRLSIIFRQTKLSPEIIPELKDLIRLIDTELWPVIVKVLELYASERGLAIEKACRTIRYIIRCIKPEWLISRVAETMVNLYRSYPQNSSPVYICSILVDEFGNRSPEINQGLFNMLEIFCTLTFTLLNMESSQQKSLLTMKSYPETIDDMMRLFNRFMKRCPSEFVNCKALESIIELSISSLRIDHQDANSNVSRFVMMFINLGQSEQVVDGDNNTATSTTSTTTNSPAAAASNSNTTAPIYLYPHIRDAIRNVLGARFVDAVIRACLFDLPSGLIGEEAQILMTLYYFDKDLFNTWVDATVSNLPKTNIQGIESVSPEQLEDFKKTITTEGSSIKKVVNCLRAFARLYT